MSTGIPTKTPTEWCRIEGVEIPDPDGWRGVNGRPWNDPITLAEFKTRLVECTQRSVAPATEHHVGTLELSGEGNAPASVVSDEIVQLGALGIDDQYDWRPEARSVLEAAYPAIRQQVAEEIAVAIAELEGYDGNCDCQDCVSTARLVEVAREIGAGVARGTADGFGS